ncbi:MAG: hypothetical protein ALECFALPRED_004772 [Alectoria fallacina]|uniref:Polyketide synthase n=1 Tax=Alectoria fallacina TaxID=1903189 RepID=A0A8H3G0M6_9LECA|nr:MAG: hypothetical protein ALECFALPRED_004772 [Alectoria fallacina]
MCQDKDIAIIGMSCRVAGANSPSELWHLLASSRDVQSKITRFNSQAFYHPDGGPRKGLTNVNKAYMLDDTVIDKFDNAFFYITPLEAMAMDPQQRMLLEIAYEAVEGAGIPLDDFTGTDTAVFAGMEGCEYHTIAARDLDATPRYLATGTPTCMAANRISYFFDLSGPSLSVDTACSSAMVALHQAVRTLQHGDSKMAIVCGAKLILSPDMFMPSSELGFLSPTGRCHTFDATADGYGRGEGIIALLLKPLKEAIADRDPIRAVIKGTRLNQDGKTQGITLPSADAQKRNMQALYEELGILPADIQYLEAHGTGTVVGDSLEFSAISSVYGKPRGTVGPLVVGSVKSSIGHLEACSALGSVMKVVQCLERAQIPPQMNFRVPNPKIDFQNVEIPNQMTSWPTSNDGTRRAAVNSFGAGGTNGHAVLEAYSRGQPQFPILEKRPYLFKVSSADDVSLKENMLRFAEYVETSKPVLRDLAHTMLGHRSTLRKSLFFTESSHEGVVAALSTDNHNVYTKPNVTNKGLILLFTGQGAQWAQMGMSLMDHSLLFRSMLHECDRLLSELPDPPAWTLIEELSKATETSNIYKAEFSQPLCTALQLGLVAVLESWGVTPDAVVGHSSGEICAAYAAGILSLRDAMVVSYYRGLVLGRCTAQKSEGSMCAVGLNEGDSKTLIEAFAGRVQIAAVNSPSSCTLSGNVDAIREIVKQLAEEKQFCRELKVDQAYHSHHMLPMALEYDHELVQANVTPLHDKAKCAMYSSVYGRRIETSECTPSYWKQNMTSTVRFSEALEQCLNGHPNAAAIIEVGPHSALKGPAHEILHSLGKSHVRYVPTCMRGQKDFETLLSSAGVMIGIGLPLRTANINAREIVDGLHCCHEPGNILTDAPSYRWNHSQGFWAESRVSRNVRFRKFPRHELLGSRYVDDIPNRPSWRNRLILKEITWLQELKAEGLTEMPAAAYLLMAVEAARQLCGNRNSDADSLCISNVHFDQPLPLSLYSRTDAGPEVQLIARQMDGTDKSAFEIFSQSPADEDLWTRHCYGNFETEATAESPILNSQKLLHDQVLLDHARTLGHSVGVGLNNFKLSLEGSSGEFERSIDGVKAYPVQPSVLNSILELPPISLLGQNLPAEHHLSSIASLTVPILRVGSDCGRFVTHVKPLEFCNVQSDIEISQCKGTISLKGLHHQATKVIHQKPSLNSLFFKPILRPDITRLAATTPMDISRCAELLTHKWPMCDIKINEIPENCTLSILEAFRTASGEARSYLRSMNCSSIPPGIVSDRVQLVNLSDMTSKYHMIFTQDVPSVVQQSDRLHPGGFLCIPKAHLQHLESNQRAALEVVRDISGLGSDPWMLLQRATDLNQACAGRRAVMFTDQRVLPSLNALKNLEYVPLEPAAVARFCKQDSFAKFDAKIIDCDEKSVITTWTGKELMPWVRVLLKSADSILWVTSSRHKNPFANVAGSLLRTLQSEQPSLKISWLLIDEMANQDRDTFASQVEQAFVRMAKGENELVTRIGEPGLEILRYLPDDDLSADTGLGLPRKVRSPLGEADYSLTFAAPREPVILSHIASSTHSLIGDTIEVLVEASVLGSGDLRMFNDPTKIEVSRSQSGLFFAGRVLNSQDPEFPPDSRVAGWHPDHTHRIKVNARSCDIFRYPSSMQPSYAASRCSAMAIASCVVDGAARARQGETFLLEVQGPLLDTIKQLCKHLGASVLDSCSELKADFVVTFKRLEGICVNGRPIDIASYLQSDHGRAMVRRNWQEMADIPLQIDEYEIADYEGALQNAKQPCSTILLHRDAAKIVNHVPIYKKAAHMFTDRANYIVIGGLGGLGRFICSWMIENGAKYITTISRSGAGTPEAKDAMSAMNSSGASLRCIKADACDRKAVSEIVSKLRSERPIKGVINLAMVLGDAPMATMSAEEWDLGLRVKIDSSWILHEETLRDPLEFFILFSSIASVLGNRSQGNYNVANSFLNALAEYRQSLDLPGISVALGAMTDMGVLYSLSKPDMLQILSRSGLTHLSKHHLAKIMEAAILESPRRDRSLVLTGLNMFEREADGSLAGQTEPLFWTDWPEFGHLQQYKLPAAVDGSSASKALLKDQVAAMRHKGETEQMRAAVRNAFLSFLSQLLGFGADAFDPSLALMMYGIDSLSGVSCQYWFHKELGVDVPAGKVLGGDSIESIVDGVVQKLTQDS